MRWCWYSCSQIPTRDWAKTYSREFSSSACQILSWIHSYMAPFSTSPSKNEDNICRKGKIIAAYERQFIIEHFSPSRDGSILHRSLSTNATTCRNLNNLNVVPKHSSHSHESCESPKVQNMEEISLMSLEKDLKTLEELNNNAIKRKPTFSNHLSRFFQRQTNKFRNWNENFVTIFINDDENLISENFFWIEWNKCWIKKLWS